jgi:hypothetical protein
MIGSLKKCPCGDMSMAGKLIPDRSAEPAVQESLDADKSTTAANSNEVDPEAQDGARDDEGNAIGVAQTGDDVPGKARPDSDAGSQ